MTDLSLFATVPRGLESLLAGELRGLGAAHVRQVRAGVAFSGSLETAYRACLWSRLAGRVLLPVVSGKAGDGDELYATAQTRGLGPSTSGWTTRWRSTSPAPTSASGTRASAPCASRTRSSTSSAPRPAAPGRRSTRARRTCASTRTSPATRVAISIDLSGQSLHRRGYRADKVQVEAPLKENLAAGAAALRGLAERGRRRRQPPGPALRVGHAARSRRR